MTRISNFHPRATCSRCRRACSHCLCSLAIPFSSDALFVILLHPKEARRTIGTARIVKLCLQETVLIEGSGPGFDRDPRLQAILSDPSLDPWLLFPGPSSLPIEIRPRDQKKRPAFLVVDGTWPQAKKMIRTSQLLSKLPRVSFESIRISTYGFRRQPAKHCLSTVEAVHEVITRLEPHRDPSALLTVFSELVRDQLAQTYGQHQAQPRIPSAGSQSPASARF